MREIKFRAWDKDEILVQPLNNIYGLQRFLGFLSDDAILMQYTGLKDKNGKEIYEGDVVNVYVGDSIACHDSLGRWNEPHRIEYQKEVKWINCGLTWEGSGCILCKENTKYFEIIGNIYSNPELLK